MQDFLVSDLFKYVLFPLCGATFGILLKIVTRNDRYTAFKKEDLAVGLELMLSGSLMFVLLTTDAAIKLCGFQEQLNAALSTKPQNKQLIDAIYQHIEVLTNKLSVAGWTILAMFVALWSVSTIVRKWGWEDENKLRPVIGIAIPLFVGVLFLVLVMGSAI